MLSGARVQCRSGLCLIFASSVLAKEALRHQCTTEYGAAFRDFLRESGAHMRTDLATSLEEHGLVLDAAEAQLLRCRSLRGGGRYWDIELKLHEYLSSVSWTWTYGSGKEGEALGRLMPFGLCAPLSCSAQVLRSEVVPQFVGHLLGLNTTTIRLGAPSDAVLKTRELVLWQELPLDFVIAGIDRCGTSSLHHNLGQHPEIAFLKPFGEDSLLLFQRSLPSREELEVCRSRRAEHAEHADARCLAVHVSAALVPQDCWVHAILESSQDGTGFEAPRRDSKGFGSVSLGSSLRPPGALLLGLLAAKKTRPPLRRVAEALPTKARAQQVSPSSTPPRCWTSVAAALDDLHGGFQSEEHRQKLQSNPNGAQHPLLERHRFGPSLPGIRKLFRDRVLMIHQDSLRNNARETWNRIATFLGASPFPSQAQFPRKNALPGHRTDLCRNASAVRRLKRILEPEYQDLWTTGRRTMRTYEVASA
ncbi:unnamed protein product [Symbiodinium necroappetens]|uniref:Sulfotransferase domain-containing protein n=1 Tax=Symbiodinium necroappetens TaxID=1628268 RepID=A0A812NFS5_9DINO|nr:unnamed protein product [Symbiodinium necroappetens]